MRASVILFAICSMLSGCDVAADKIASRMFGDKLVVVASSPITLSGRPTEIAAPEPLEVLGEWTAVCLVLKESVPLADSQTLDSELAEAMHSSKVNAAVYLDDGSRRPLSAPTASWRKSGAILSSNELSGCANTGCLPRLPRGAFVTKVVLTAEPDLRVQGVYWASSPDLPSKKPSEPAKAATSTSKGRSCG